jgi:hypothetical protein
MTSRVIVAAERREKSTIIKLDCGHERSIGGHTWPGGKPVGRPEDLVRFRVRYDCQDGHCGGRRD